MAPVQQSTGDFPCCIRFVATYRCSKVKSARTLFIWYGYNYITMIPLNYLAAIFQKEKEDVLKWIRQNKITASKIGNSWMVDEASFYHVIRLNLKLSGYDKYLEEEVKIREEEITNILVLLDDLIYLLKSINKISPLLRLLIREMASLLPTGLPRSIFIDVTSGIGISKCVETYGLSFSEACHLYNSAIKSISHKLGFITEYRNILAQEKLNIRRLEIINRNQEEKIRILSDELERVTLETVEDEGQSKLLIPVAAIRTLSLNLATNLDLDTRCVNSLASLGIRTVEDLLRYIRYDGLSRLRTARNFGESSLRRLRYKLTKAGIIDDNEQSYLFEYL